VIVAFAPSMASSSWLAKIAFSLSFYPSTLGAIIASLMLKKKFTWLSRRWNFDTILRLALLGCLIVGTVGATLAIIHVVAHPNPAADRTEPPDLPPGAPGG
jgi:hypothetical protein